VEENEQRVSRKQKVIEAQGKDVPLDYFLYSCLEQERTLKAVDKKAGGEQPPNIIWPMLLPDSEEANELATMPLAALLTRMAAWYRNEFPALAGHVPLDHQVLSEVLTPFVSLCRDISTLYRVRTGDALPDFESSVGNNKFWDDIIKTVQSTFTGYQTWFIRYIQWSHAPEPKEDFEPGSRPPVGRYAPLQPRDGRGGDRGGRGGGGGGFRDRGPRGGGGGGGGGNFRGGGDRGPRGDGGNFRGGGDRGPRGGGGDGGNFRNDRGGGGGGGGGGGDRGPRRERGGEPDANTIKMTEQATQEVERAIKMLVDDSALDEVTLKPTNSFYRRIQHQHIVDMGYHSFSVGEGPDRAVKVARREEED
jgi:hypothetical protein